MGLDFDENIKILNVKLSLLCSVSVPAFSSLFFTRIPKCWHWISREHNPCDGNFCACSWLDWGPREGIENSAQQRQELNWAVVTMAAFLESMEICGAMKTL